MRRIIFLWLTFIVSAGCRLSAVPPVSKATAMETIQIPTTDISATIEVLPAGPDIQSSKIVLQAFFDAYNRHDFTGVLATLAETFAYGDCDFAERQMLGFETKPDLSIWLQRKFAHEDQFQVIELIIAPPEGSPANDPRLAAVQVIRTSQTLKKLSQEKQSLFKIVLSPEGNRIQYINAYGNVDCEAGR